MVLIKTTIPQISHDKPRKCGFSQRKSHRLGLLPSLLHLQAFLKTLWWQRSAWPGPNRSSLAASCKWKTCLKFNEMTHDFSNNYLEVQPLHHLSLESPEMIHFRKQMDCMGPLILRLPKHATMPCHPVALPNKHLSHPKAASEPSQCVQKIKKYVKLSRFGWIE